MADWGSVIGGLAPLAFGAAGALTAQPNTTSTNKQATFLTPQSEGLYNQGIDLGGRAATQPYAANSWIENAQRMLGATALDPTPGNVIGQTAETLGGLSNRLGSMGGGANWNANPGAMQSAVQANMNPWNNLVRDQTMAYAQEAADRANAADRAGAAQNMSGFGDRSQIAMELGRDKRQQGLNALQANLNQQGFNNALAQTNVNNALGRADIGQLSGLALQQPGLAQMNRANQIGNAQLLQTEGVAQRDFPWQQANNAINASTKTMGSNSLESKSVNPWTTGISAGLAALNPAIQAGISSGVNALGGLFNAGTNAASSAAGSFDWPSFNAVSDSMASGADLSGVNWFDFGFKEGGRVKRFKQGGRARYDEGGVVLPEDEETPPLIDVTPQVAEARADEPAPLPPVPAPRPALGGITLGGAAQRRTPMPAPAVVTPANRPATPVSRPPVTVGGQNLEDEYIRRLMAGPDPAEMRTAREDERRAMSALLAEYKPQQSDWRRALSDLGVGMADPENRSFGNAFARGVGYMQKGIDQRDSVERQARRELAQIQLKMSSENRKELTDAEKTRLTTLASMIRERNAAADRREIATENRLSREDLAREALELRRQIAAGQDAYRQGQAADRADRQLYEQQRDWEAMVVRQEPTWRRAATAAAANVHPEDAPAFIEDYVQRQREAFEQRTPRPSRAAPSAAATPAAAPAASTQAPATAGAPAPRPATGGIPAPAAQPPAAPAQAPAGAPPATPEGAAPTTAPVRTSAPAPGAPDPRLGFRPRPPGPGDVGESAEVARRLNVPAVTNPPWRGLSPKKTEELIIKERQDFLKLDDDREKDLGQAERIEQLGREFLSLNSRASTGTWDLNTPIVRQVSVLGNTNLQRMRSLTAELAPLNRIAGTGAVSDFDAEQLVQQAPSIDKTPAANRMIIEYRLAAARNLQEKAAFDRAYFEANQTMQGARAAWDEYKNSNPLAIEVERGRGDTLPPFRLNTNRMSWQQYFRMKDLERREGAR